MAVAVDGERALLDQRDVLARALELGSGSGLRRVILVRVTHSPALVANIQTGGWEKTEVVGRLLVFDGVVV